MPDITLTWRRDYKSRCQKYNDQIYEVVWKRNGDLMMRAPGLYVIQDDSGPVYAGKTQRLALRFGGRSEVLREFRLSTSTTNPVATHIVDLATVSPQAELGLAEKWLVRILHLEDLGGNRYRLQNIDITRPLRVTDALTITNVRKPAYLDKQYTYDAGTTI